jgi:hypothetical protein
MKLQKLYKVVDKLVTKPIHFMVLSSINEIKES